MGASGRDRVAMLIRAYAPTVGGAERQLGAVAPLLRQRGLDVHVITRRENGLPAYSEVDGVPVHRVPVPGPQIPASLAYTAGAVRLLRSLEVDVVHAHEFFSPGTAAAVAKRLLGLPVVATAHRSGPYGDIEYLRAGRAGERRLATLRRTVDRFVVISQEIQAELLATGVGPERQVHIPNGVDVQRFRPPEPGERAVLRRELGLPVQGPLVLFTGRLAEEKRVDRLLDVWPSVRLEHPDAVLAVLGDGPLAPALRAREVAGVHMVGLVDDVAPFHRAADLFVLPSVAEGLSVAMLEAMASGVPPLMTRVGGTAEVLEHGENGWLYQPDDDAALEQGLRLLLRDDALRERAGTAARATVERGYTLDDSVTRLVSLYEEMLAARR